MPPLRPQFIDLHTPSSFDYFLDFHFLSQILKQQIIKLVSSADLQKRLLETLEDQRELFIILHLFF